jgi:hypothetical protein
MELSGDSDFAILSGKVLLFLPLVPKGNRLIFQFAPFRVGANKLKNKCKMQSVKVELR